MKLFLSALLLAALPAAFAQNPAPEQNNSNVPGEPSVQGGQDQGAYRVDDLVARSVPRACPVFLTAANVDAPARIFPVADASTSGDGALKLRFQYRSKLPIRSVSITAHLRVKTNKYALDARNLDVPLTIQGTPQLNRPGEHFLQLSLPNHVYLYGVARVSVNSVTFTDGEVLTPNSPEMCGVNGQGAQRIEAK